MKLFPILLPSFSADEREVKRAGFGSLRALPWDMIEPHENQALRNHDQSLATLASRGGLSACEALAVLEDRAWRQMPLFEAYRGLDALISLHTALKRR